MPAHYYNDNDPYAVAWLRTLIEQETLPAGDVDDRSIEKVKAHEIRGYTQCHFFAGIGGWPLALRMAGVPDDFPVWTGSCPCQPISSAGRRKGHADARHLWPAFHSLIAERRPAIVFGENVRYILCGDGRVRPIPPEPGLFPLAHGVPCRVGRLRAYGNAIVPQVGAAFIRAGLDAIGHTHD